MSDPKPLDNLDDFRRSWQEELNVAEGDNRDNQHVGNLLVQQPSQTETKKELQSFVIAQKLLRGENFQSKSLSSAYSLTDEKTKIVSQLANTKTNDVSWKSDESQASCSRTCHSENAIKHAASKRVNYDLKRKKVSWSRLQDDFFQANKKSKATNDHTESPTSRTESFLDALISDIDEVTAIPFFDLELPREVAINIFHNLETKDLCRCSQVSRAWKHLAEDELLWCNICHRLGFDQHISTLEKQQWKEWVKRHVLTEQNATLNWRGRVMNGVELQHVRGGVLCSANAHLNTVVAGYSSGEVCTWDTSTYEQLFLHTSSKALILDERFDSGTIQNYPDKVAISNTHTVAAFSQGNIDIWEHGCSQEPVYTWQSRQHISHLSTALSFPLWAAGFRSNVVIFGKTHELQEISIIETVQLPHEVTGVLITPTSNNGCGLAEHVVVVAAGDEVRVQRVGAKAQDNGFRTIHHAYQQYVSSMDATHEDAALAINGPDFYEVRLYSLGVGRHVSTLLGHPCRVRCINMELAPPHSLVTGCADGRVRVFDTRLSEPVAQLSGHSRPVTAVQMDEWKVVSGAEDGMVRTWDQRMTNCLWDIHNRHPVRYVYFHKQLMVTANIPTDPLPSEPDCDDLMLPRRLRGSLNAYDFSANKMREDLPTNAISTYDEPEGYSYNITLATPYDAL